MDTTTEQRNQTIIDAAVKAVREHGGESVQPGRKNGALVVLIIKARGKFLNVYVGPDDDADTIRGEIVRQLAEPSALS
jgi:hypothetical protein